MPSSIRSWPTAVECMTACRMGYNQAMDELRRRRVVAGTVDESPSADSVDRRLMIEEGLGQVSHLDRQIIFLHAYAGFKTDEIGILLGISGPAVRQRLYRARQRIRRLYESDG
jgi:DNA-directed RNA polymerase specialized sigma24 family protein